MSTRISVILLVGLAACAELQGTGSSDTAGGPDPDSPRVLDGLEVLYTFQEGDGLDVHDVSGVEPAFDLQLDNLVTNKWLPDGGIEVSGPSVITSPEVAEKVFVDCVKANAVTLEAWIEPVDLTKQATIFTYSRQDHRNTTLAIDTTRYSGAVLTSTVDPMDSTQTISSVQTTQTPTGVAAMAAQHVIYTRDVNGAVVYVNGVDTKPPSTNPPTTPTAVLDQTEWSPADQLALANETAGNRPFLGKIYMAAVYCRALSPTEVAKNYAAGY
jgi:hypothetical protein